MSQASSGAGSTRHRAFFIWAAILSLVFGLLFIGVTALGPRIAGILSLPPVERTLAQRNEEFLDLLGQMLGLLRHAAGSRLGAARLRLGLLGVFAHAVNIG